MADLSVKMRKVPFTMLAIPGTHNSATHTMQSDQPMSYDSPLYADLSSMTPETLASWGRRVKHDINQQLEMGIRYFDFRFRITVYLSLQLSFKANEAQNIHIRSLERQYCVRNKSFR